MNDLKNCLHLSSASNDLANKYTKKKEKNVEKQSGISSIFQSLNYLFNSIYRLVYFDHGSANSLVVVLYIIGENVLGCWLNLNEVTQGG